MLEFEFVDECTYTLKWPEGKKENHREAGLEVVI